MVRQLIVQNKQLCFCIFKCQNLWNQKIGHQIAQGKTQWTIHSAEHSNSLFTIVITAFASCKSASGRLVKTLSIAL